LAFYFLAAFIDLAPWKLPNKGKTQVSAPAVDARFQSIKFKGILASDVERERATAGKAASN